MLEIFILSFIQGLTEFLPVSSSGHLILLPYIIGFQNHSLEIDGIVHLGTLCAVVCYFFFDIRRIITSFFSVYIGLGKPSLDGFDASFARIGLTIIVATLPVVVAGLLLKRIGIDVVRGPHVIAIMAIAGGIALYFADRLSSSIKGLQDMTFMRALLVGCIQIIALIPGSSRSGMCIMGARLLGFDKVSSTRYAFLLSIPAILGAFTLIFFDAYCNGIQTPLANLGAYFILSFFFGLGSIHFMLRFIQHHSLLIFMIYRIILGGGILLMT
ncbi:MAG: undecaprenyl-diphosphate phosphatase [Alphaproteobacteria bacterium]|nr:undecaprenyl-diphosphate phosphatase [Alphaproteobacteria bacterium]